MALPDSVLREVELHVHSRDRQIALWLLEQCGNGLKPDYREKILLAVVRLAGRSTDKLLEMVDAAKNDPRDVEFWAGADENRRQFFAAESDG